jgi:SAM-dependent methyltransferase
LAHPSHAGHPRLLILFPESRGRTPQPSQWDDLLKQMAASQVVLDLGCGNRSFHYETCPSRIVALDEQFVRKRIEQEDPRIQYVLARSQAIPLADSSIDAVVCHHTLEHFDDYKKALAEIGRVLRPEGWLWIAIPNGYGFDDRLYRFVFAGGGHVNRFTREGLVKDVQTITGLTLVSMCDFFSSFIYLKKPSPSELQYFPDFARRVTTLPNPLLSFAILLINFATRIMDKTLGHRSSQYGWGFVFSKTQMKVAKLASCFNVCRKCGAGHPFDMMKRPTIFGLGFYHCPNCKELNSLVAPPRGLD